MIADDTESVYDATKEIFQIQAIHSSSRSFSLSLFIVQ